MKRIFAIGVLIASVMGILSLFSGTASAAPFVCTPGAVLVSGNVAKVSNDPDSGDKGNWATDNFIRSTDVKVLSCGAKNQPDTYQVIVRDAGTFTTLPDGPSPRQGLPLPAKPFTGSFAGGTTYTVTSSQPPLDYLTNGPVIAPISGSPGTGAWWSRFFHTHVVALQEIPNTVDEGWTLNGSEDAYFSWTYTTTCASDKKLDEKWVDSNSDNGGANKNAGDITGKGLKCVVTPPTTTTPPPVSTVTTPPVTSVVVVPGPTNTVTNNTVTTQQVASVPVGAPQTGFGGAYKNSDVFWLYGGIASVIGAMALFGYAFFRRGTRVTS